MLCIRAGRNIICCHIRVKGDFKALCGKRFELCRNLIKLPELPAIVRVRCTDIQPVRSGDEGAAAIVIAILQTVVENLCIVDAILCRIEVKSLLCIHDRVGDADIPLQALCIDVCQRVVNRAQRVDALNFVSNGLRPIGIHQLVKQRAYLIKGLFKLQGNLKQLADGRLCRFFINHTVERAKHLNQRIRRPFVNYGFLFQQIDQINRGADEMLAGFIRHADEIAIGQEREVVVQRGSVKRAEEQLAVIFHSTPDILHAAKLRAVGKGVQRFGEIVSIFFIKIFIRGPHHHLHLAIGGQAVDGGLVFHAVFHCLQPVKIGVDILIAHELYKGEDRLHHRIKGVRKRIVVEIALVNDRRHHVVERITETGGVDRVALLAEAIADEFRPLPAIFICTGLALADLNAFIDNSADRRHQGKVHHILINDQIPYIAGVADVFLQSVGVKIVRPCNGFKVIAVRAGLDAHRRGNALGNFLRGEQGGVRTANIEPLAVIRHVIGADVAHTGLRRLCHMYENLRQVARLEIRPYAQQHRICRAC